MWISSLALSARTTRTAKAWSLTLLINVYINSWKSLFCRIIMVGVGARPSISSGPQGAKLIEPKEKRLIASLL